MTRVVGGPCLGGPDRCMDDLCRGTDVGLCGAWSDRLFRMENGDDEDEPYYDEDEAEAHG